MAISKWVKHWLGIDQDIEDIRKEVLEDIRQEMEKRTREIIHDEYTHYKEASLKLEALRKDLLSKFKVIDSRLEELQMLETKIQSLERLADTMNQIENLEHRMSSLEQSINSHTNKIKFSVSEINKALTDYKECKPQITEISKQSSEVLKQINNMKNDVESGIDQFRSELGPLVKHIVGGDLSGNFMTYLKLPENSTIATSNDVSKVDNDLSVINKKINQDHNTVIKICDFLVKIFGGNTEVFNDFSKDFSNELITIDHTQETTNLVS